MANMVSLKDKRTLSVHVEHEFLLKMEKAGLTEPFAQKVIDSKDNELAAKVVKFIQSGGFGPTDSQKHAHEIMGKNMFGIEEAIQHFGVNPTRQQTLALSEGPFLEETLQKRKDTHVLEAVFPLSILEIRGKVDPKLFKKQSWYDKKSFAMEQGEISWQLVRKTLQGQQALVSEDNEVPSAQVMVYTIIGHYLATGERLFKHSYVRTSSILANLRVIVGYFARGLSIAWDWCDSPGDNLSVSSTRKI